MTLNTQQNYFKQDFFKLRNKEIFRKPCKFLEKDRDVKLVKREKKKFLVREANY